MIPQANLFFSSGQVNSESFTRYLEVATYFGSKWSALFPCAVSVLYEH